MHISHNILQLGHQDILIILHVHQTKNIFQTIIFFLYYSPCPNLEGIKDALFYSSEGPRLVRITVPYAQTRVAIVSAIELYSQTNSWHKAPRVSRVQ